MLYIKLLTRYIRDAVYGANDGIITTFAIVSSVEGANLGTKAILVVGFASLFADGFSMASSDFLANKAELARKKSNNMEEQEKHNPRIAALFTFLAFIIVGIIPLVPYFFITLTSNSFIFSGIATGLALFGVGALRTKLTGGNPYLAGGEMLLIGGSAAAVAFFIGSLIEQWQ
ncbi:MAG TPA: VIT1/CCC1 transporter family protein [Salegentibacter sp.]|uniref:VIT1/CCC1 transporter family protein n=1 Tax=Salegentibacter sp. TaxID=1903072 RepID=UPI002F931C4E